MTVPSVDASNRAALQAWDGAQGAFWAARADRFAAGVAAYSEHLLTAAAIGVDEDVLDVGCGAGELTRGASERGRSALGVDLSSALLGVAREHAPDRENLTYLQADAQVHPFGAASFDVVISRNGVMFFGDVYAAFTNIARSIRPGGRLIMLTWAPVGDNEWLLAFRSVVAPGAPPPKPTPASMSDPAHIRELLTTAGFADVTTAPLAEPMYLGRDVADATEFLTGQFATAMSAMAEPDRTRAVAALTDTLTEHAGAHGVYLDTAAWLIEAKRPSGTQPPVTAS